MLLPGTLLGSVTAPGGPVTDYTRWLDHEEQRWNSAHPPPADRGLHCYRHPDRSFYIGTKSTLTIKAPLAAVEKVLDNVGGYPDIFIGFEEIALAGKTDTGFVVHWHRAVPVFFIPDLRYEVVYRNTKDNPARKIYRFQLKNKIDLLKGLDGMMVLDAADSHSTVFTQYLFLDGRYGPLETFNPTRIWDDGVRGFYLANLGVKMRAESPALDREPLRAAIQKAYNADLVQNCIAAKTVHPGIPAPHGATP